MDPENDDYWREVTAVEAWLSAELDPLVPSDVQWRISCTRTPVIRRWRVEERLEFEQTVDVGAVSIWEPLRHRPLRRGAWVVEATPREAGLRLRATIVQLAETSGFATG